MPPCLFYKNEADKEDASAQGGALYDNNASVNLINCTFARNQCGAADGGGGIYHAAGNTLSLRNCILWDNKTEDSSPPDAEGDQIKIAGGSATATWTCIQDIDTLDGENNTDLDPLFENSPSDNYDLNPANCGDQSCTSSGIDFSGDGDCNSGCEVKDVKRRERRVNRDNRTGQVLDKGALETQSAS